MAESLARETVVCHVPETASYRGSATGALGACAVLESVRATGLVVVCCHVPDTASYRDSLTPEVDARVVLESVLGADSVVFCLEPDTGSYRGSRTGAAGVSLTGAARVSSSAADAGAGAVSEEFLMFRAFPTRKSHTICKKTILVAIGCLLDMPLVYKSHFEDTYAFIFRCQSPTQEDAPCLFMPKFGAKRCVFCTKLQANAALPEPTNKLGLIGQRTRLSLCFPVRKARVGWSCRCSP